MPYAKNLLLLILAFCVLLLTFFICWAFYYLIMFLKGGKKIVDEIKEKPDRIDDILDTIKRKIESSTSHLALLAQGASWVIDFLKERKKKKEEKENQEEDEILRGKDKKKKKKD